MSNRLIKKINISDNEEVIDIIRKSWWHWGWSMMLTILLLLLPFFLIYPLFLQGTWGVVLFGVIVFSALVLLYRAYRMYYYTALIITNRRLIDMEQSGLLGHSSGVVLYGKIQDVNFKTKGLLKTIFNIGHIYIFFTNDNNSFIELQSIKNPALIVGRIINQRENYFELKGKTAGQEAIKLLARIKRRLGEDKFNKLISN